MSARKAVIYCTCCDTLLPVLPAETLKQQLAAGASLFITARRLCDREDAQACVTQALDAGVRACVAAGCSYLARGAEAVRYMALPVEWVDIREACAWIHAGQPDQALAKAVDYIRMGLAALERRPAEAPARAAPLGPAEPVLIVGAGPAGLAAAAVLADAGIRVTLAERRPAPGGMLQQLGLLFPDLSPAAEVLSHITNRTDNGVDRRFGCTATGIQTTEKGYQITLSQGGRTEEFQASAVILATGALPVLPTGYFRYKELEGVSSQMELEVLLSKAENGQTSLSALPHRALFLQCVAARSEKQPYCSTICCPTAIKNALRLKMLRPETDVTLVHRNIVTPGIALEALYRRATEKGMRLRSFAPESVPEVLGQNSVEGLRIVDALSGITEELPADMLVCSTPLKPAPDTAKLARSIGLRLDNMGFVCGREPMQPLEPALAGIFICGSARCPATVAQAIEQGSAAAMKALHHVRNSGAATACRAWNGELHHPAEARGEACSRCGRCVAACPYGACVLPASGPMQTWTPRCRHCGSCAAVCPCGAVVLPSQSFSALRARIREAIGGTPA